MNPWEIIDSAPVPDGGEVLLYKRADEFSIRVDCRELMNSRVHGSEDALAEHACDKLANRSNPHILVGGLGMGYTLAAALQQLGPAARVTVAELVPAVVAWNRGSLAHLAGDPLRDARVTVCEVDVTHIFKRKELVFDAILLDVDNGPKGLTRKSNDWLYSHAGLEAAYASLLPRGVLAVWSARPHRIFVQRMQQVGFEVEEIRSRARGLEGGGRHTIWIAQRGVTRLPT